MAINRPATQPNPEQELSLIINNGDLTALKAVVRELGFKNEESALRFALAVLARSATRAISIVERDGKTVSLSPSVELLKSADTPSQS